MIAALQCDNPQHCRTECNPRQQSPYEHQQKLTDPADHHRGTEGSARCDDDNKNVEDDNRRGIVEQALSIYQGAQSLGDTEFLK